MEHFVIIKENAKGISAYSLNFRIICVILELGAFLFIINRKNQNLLEKVKSEIETKYTKLISYKSM